MTERSWYGQILLCLPYLLLAAFVSTVLLHPLIFPRISSSPSPFSLPHPSSSPSSSLSPFSSSSYSFSGHTGLHAVHRHSGHSSAFGNLWLLPGFFFFLLSLHGSLISLRPLFRFDLFNATFSLSSAQTHSSSSSIISRDLLVSFPLALPSFLSWFIFPSQSSPLDWKHQVRRNLCLFYSVLSPQCQASACLIQNAPKNICWVNQQVSITAITSTVYIPF